MPCFEKGFTRELQILIHRMKPCENTVRKRMGKYPTGFIAFPPPFTHNICIVYFKKKSSFKAQINLSYTKALNLDRSKFFSSA